MRRGPAATGIRGSQRLWLKTAAATRDVQPAGAAATLDAAAATPAGWWCACLLAAFLHAQGSCGSPWRPDLASHRTCPHAPPGPWWRAPGPRRSPAMAVGAAAAGLHARGVAHGGQPNPARGRVELNPIEAGQHATWRRRRSRRTSIGGAGGPRGWAASSISSSDGEGNISSRVALQLPQRPLSSSLEDLDDAARPPWPPGPSWGEKPSTAAACSSWCR